LWSVEVDTAFAEGETDAAAAGRDFADAVGVVVEGGGRVGGGVTTPDVRRGADTSGMC
jgi:hypothetical protein